MMRGERTAYKPRCARAAAEFFNGFDGSFLEQRVICQAEIIVGRKVQQPASLNAHARGLRRIYAAQFAEKSLRADFFQAPLDFGGKTVVHAGTMFPGSTAHCPPIMLAATGPRCPIIASLALEIFSPYGMAITSAKAPGASSPILPFNPSARAPLIVAIFRMLSDSRFGFAAANWRISSNMFNSANCLRGLCRLARLSVPRQIFTSALASSSSGNARCLK